MSVRGGFRVHSSICAPLHDKRVAAVRDDHHVQSLCQPLPPDTWVPLHDKRVAAVGSPVPHPHKGPNLDPSCRQRVSAFAFRHWRFFVA